MRDEEIDIVLGEPGFLDGLPQGLAEDACGEAEDLIAVHADVVQTVIQGLLAGRHGGAAGRHNQVLSAGAVRSQYIGEHAGRLVAHLQQDRAGPIPKEHTSGTVFPVGEAAEEFDADDENVVARTVGNELLGCRQGVNEACTTVYQGESAHTFGAESMLYLR